MKKETKKGNKKEPKYCGTCIIGKEQPDGTMHYIHFRGLSYISEPGIENALIRAFAVPVE